jgi:alpha-mannosidase
MHIKKDLVFHLIGNSHLDPVWLWDWREGLNEGLITVRAILDLMDKNPDATYIRGESCIYEHIEKNDPHTFKRITAYVKEGRWDVVGGSYLQPDTNLPATETFVRHYTKGLNYFWSRFRKRVRVAWAADSFGHSAGLPEIYSAAGIEYFTFFRPGQKLLPLSEPAFWWKGPGNSKVLSYRPLEAWYGCERDEISKRLDVHLTAAQNGNFKNVAVFYGLGNHGGGPSQQHLRDIRKWAATHPNIQVIHSGLHRFFDELKTEIHSNGKDSIPSHRGELNFCFRGCYSSVSKFKFLYRKAEASLFQAERTASIIQAGLNSIVAKKNSSLDTAWDGLLFNSFHDILPGSSIERAFDDQIAWTGGIIHQSKSAELDVLNSLATQVDTRVRKPKDNKPSEVPFLVWNPHPHPYNGPIELETCLDYRPIWDYADNPDKVPIEVRDSDGKQLPFQSVELEHLFTGKEKNPPWRKRLVIPVQLPPLGWKVVRMGWVEGAKEIKLSSRTKAIGSNIITNGFYKIRARTGSKSIEIHRNGRSLFGTKGFSLITCKDPWGAWGGHWEEPKSLDLSDILFHWKIKNVQIMESGPLRSALWVQMIGGHSQAEFIFHLHEKRDTVDVSTRIFWNEKRARLKFVMPAGDQATFEVPGGTIHRKPTGEVPGGRWVKIRNKNSSFGFASDALYNFDCKNGEFRATVLRASRYTTSAEDKGQYPSWKPTVDRGEFRFRFIMTSGDEQHLQQAYELEEPPVAVVVPSKKGPLPSSASFASLSPLNLRLLAIKPAEDQKGWILRYQELSGRKTKPKLIWMNSRIQLPEAAPFSIHTIRLIQNHKKWKVILTNIAESSR